ncbi:MAG: ABC transporter ATP-binding protein [Bacteroidales bacterium]|jgi:zinc transport system ATP-binding protein|nr:ABC transporter ATP-binding protein [Bacteroidales bacterium]
MNKPLVKLKDVTTGYFSETVLRNVNLDVFPNDFVGVIGPNGGGKTTMVKAILGILPLFKGSITFPLGKPRMGYLPQVSSIDKSFPITVKDLIGQGLKSKSVLMPRLNREQKDRVYQLMAEAGLNKFAQKPIGELSGGQLQKALLSRAIINEPQLLILDEPNTFVDKGFEKELYQWLQFLNKKMAILLVSHDIGTISPIVKTIACVNGDLHYHPSNQLTEEILKVYNCPVDIIAHGPVPHRVLKEHNL